MPFTFRTIGRAVGVMLIPLFLAACGPDAQQQADYNAVARSGVSPAVYDKMVHGDPLSLSDIVSLSHARVNDGIILRYIRDQGTVYYLHDNGVSQSIVDYMASTAPNYWGPGPYPYYGPYAGPVIPIGIGIGIGGGGGWHHWR
jgi:hypothetical protein